MPAIAFGRRRSAMLPVAALRWRPAAMAVAASTFARRRGRAVARRWAATRVSASAFARSGSAVIVLLQSVAILGRAAAALQRHRLRRGMAGP